MPRPGLEVVRAGALDEYSVDAKRGDRDDPERSSGRQQNVIEIALADRGGPRRKLFSVGIRELLLCHEMLDLAQHRHVEHESKQQCCEYGEHAAHNQLAGRQWCALWRCGWRASWSAGWSPSSYPRKSNFLGLRYPHFRSLDLFGRHRIPLPRAASRSTHRNFPRKNNPTPNAPMPPANSGGTNT